VSGTKVVLIETPLAQRSDANVKNMSGEHRTRLAIFGGAHQEHQPTDHSNRVETVKMLANGIEPKLGKEGEAWNRQQVQRIDLRWHDLRHEGVCQLLADGVDIRITQLMLGHASIQQTQRYLNVTDEELRKGLEVSWKNQGRPIRLALGH
jgi:integrase